MVCALMGSGKPLSVKLPANSLLHHALEQPQRDALGNQYLVMIGFIARRKARFVTVPIAP
jgi:hypothetical protein